MTAHKASSGVMRNIKTPSVTQLLSTKEPVRDFWNLLFQTIKKVPSIFSSFINCSDILALCFIWGRNKSVNYVHLFLSKLCHSDGPHGSNP